MTYEQNKRMFMALCDEYAPNNEFFTDDTDIQEKCALLYGEVYPELNQYARPRTKDIEVSQGEEVGYQRERLPNCFKVKSVTCMDSNYNEDTGHYKTLGDYIYLANDKDYIYTIEYIPRLSLITEETEDDFELELEDDACMCLPYMVASDLFKTDPGQDYRPFEAVLQRKMQMLSTSKTSMSANVSEGVFD